MTGLEYILVETRIISGRGVLLLPPEQTATMRHMVVYVDIIRYPRDDSLNFKWSYSRGDYANILFTRNDYIVREEVVRYSRTCWDMFPMDTQVLPDVSCTHNRVISSLQNGFAALGALLPIVNNDNSVPLNLYPDRLLIRCRDSTAVRLMLYVIPYSLCPELTDEPIKRPPPPPPPPTPIPPPTPLPEGGFMLSPPYDESDDDGGFTEPWLPDRPENYGLGTWLVFYGNPGDPNISITYAGYEYESPSLQRGAHTNCSKSTNTAIVTAQGRHIQNVNCNDDNVTAEIRGSSWTPDSP